MSTLHSRANGYIEQVDDARRPFAHDGGRSRQLHLHKGHTTASPLRGLGVRTQAQSYAQLYRAASAAQRPVLPLAGSMGPTWRPRPFWAPSIATFLTAGGCAVGVWLCTRVARLLPDWNGELAAALALCAGAVYASGPVDVPRRLPRPASPKRVQHKSAAASTLSDSWYTAPSSPAWTHVSDDDVSDFVLDEMTPVAQSAAQDVRASGSQTRSDATSSSQPAGAAMAGGPERASAAGLAETLQAKFVADEQTFFRASAWVQAYDVAQGEVGALALPPLHAQNGMSLAGVTHTQSVILAASLRSFGLMVPSRRNAFAEQLSLVVERHAECLDDCFKMLTDPSQTDDIARRIVCPTEAYERHEAAIDAASYQPGGADEVALARLYESAPPRYHTAPEVQPETLKAYYRAQAARLSARVVDIFGQADDALAEYDHACLPEAHDDAGRIDAWLGAMSTHNIRKSWQPHFTYDYLTIGDIAVASPSECLADKEDDVLALDMQKDIYALRDAAEDDEACRFYDAVFASPDALTQHVATSRERDSKGCLVQAFFVAHIQQLPGAPQDTARGTAPRRRVQDAARPRRQEDTTGHVTTVSKLERAIDESTALRRKCQQKRDLYERALSRPNTSMRHADLARRMTALDAWAQSEQTRCHRLQDTLRAKKWQSDLDMDLYL